MLKKNVYKPRYKIAFQSKNKIWPYKSSRLRRFFNIRGRKIVRRGEFKREVLVSNNMKWTVARRYIRPYMRRRRATKRRFRDAFYNKQKLRVFYGKIREQAFRKIFQKYLISSVNRNKGFFSSLERRIDIFFFRMRLLPTIFACHQYIHHHGILINQSAEHSPNALLCTGDVISIRVGQWKPLFWYMHDRLFYRVYGKGVSLKRKYTLIKKKTWKVRSWLRKAKWMHDIGKKRLDIKILILSRQKKFLYFFDHFVNKLQEFSLQYPVDQDLNVKHIIDLQFIRLKKLYALYNKLLGLKKKTGFSYKKLYREISKTPRLRIQSIYKRLFLLFGGGINLYLKYHFLYMQLQFEEFSFYFCLLSPIKRKKIPDRFWNLKEKKLIVKYVVLRKKVIQYYSLFFRKILTKYRLKRFYKYVKKLKRSVPKGNTLTYFLVSRSYKKGRRLRTPRLKFVHWAIPPYMYVDFRTMRALLLYPPKVNEIHYSFKCSLTKISAFYKALAY